MVGIGQRGDRGSGARDRHGRFGPIADTLQLSSTLTIGVTGGTRVTYSNISLTLGSDAAGHFGTQAVNGVVRRSY